MVVLLVVLFAFSCASATSRKLQQMKAKEGRSALNVGGIPLPDVTPIVSPIIGGGGGGGGLPSLPVPIPNLPIPIPHSSPVASSAQHSDSALHP